MHPLVSSLRPHAPVWLALLAGAALGAPRLPDPAPENAPEGTFSAARARAHVAILARAPRPSGSDAHARALVYLHELLASDKFVVVRQESGALVNLVASAKDAEPGGVWLAAHTDTVPASPGAADDGLGLGVVLEVARALSVDGPPKGLHVLLTDGEERGLRGAKAFAAQAASAPRLFLNVEARGTEGPAYMFQTAGSDAALLDAWRSAGCDAEAGSFARSVYEVLPNGTDFTVFRRMGAWGYDFALVRGAGRYHTPDDTVEHLDPPSVQQVGDCVLGLARAWLGRPLAGPDTRPVYAEVAGTMRVIDGGWVRIAGALPLLALVRTRPDARSVGGWAAAVAVAGLLGTVAMGVAVAAVPGFTTAPAEIPTPEAWFAAAGLASVAGLAAGRALRGGAGWYLPSVLMGASAAVVPAVGYVLVPGAWAAAFRLRGWHRAAAVPAFLAGLLLGPLGLAVYPALTTRLLPALAVLPVLAVSWAAGPSGRGTPPRDGGR